MNIQELTNLYIDTGQLAPEQFDGVEWLEIKFMAGDEVATADDPHRQVFDRPRLIASNLKCDLIAWYATSSHARSRGLILSREVQDVGERSLEIDAAVTFTGSDGIVHEGGSAIAKYFELPYELVFELFGYSPGNSLAEARARLKSFIDAQAVAENRNQRYD